MRRLFPWVLLQGLGLVLNPVAARALPLLSEVLRDSGSVRNCRFTFVPQAVTRLAPAASRPFR